MKLKLITLLIAISSIAGISAIAQKKVLNIYNGETVTIHKISDIDSIKVDTKLGMPTNVATLENGNSVVLSWDAVSQAKSYQIYRSGDDNDYTLLASNITKTTYTDNAPMSGANYYKVKAISTTGEEVLSQATAPITKVGENGKTGLYMGIIGFNQDISEKEIYILAPNTKSQFTQFITSLSAKNGTILYNAIDSAIDALATASLPSDLVNVALVTFTDGLDQGSFMAGKGYGSDEEYLSAVHSKIKNTKIHGLAISAYSIGLRGTDVSDIEQFQSNLENLASTPENAKEVSSMDEVNVKFQEIANQLYKENSSQTISLTIPGQANGTKIRFTFDNVSDASKSQLYIEGTFSLSDRSLKNITYGGMDSSSGTIVAGVQDGIFVTFTFNDIKSANTNYETIPTNNIKQWSYIKSTSQWQQNSEFDPENQTEITVERKSAAIMLVLDCSSSLGSQFSTMKTHAKSFIEKMAENAEKLTYNVSVTSSDPTMGTVTGSQLSVDLGASITITATPNEDYSFVNWTVNGEEVSKEATYTVTVTKDVEYVANFISYKVTVVAGEGGTAKANKTQVAPNGQVTLTATPNEDYFFVNWTVNGEEVSTKNPYTATVTANTEYKANFKALKGVENSHEWIDLGLPSGIKWATCNVGADTPEGYGDYFAWGETEPKTTYNWSTYIYCNGSYDTMTKYCTKLSYGIVDNKTTLELVDDAAHVNWGGNWRMPTRDEYAELCDTSNCTWTWTTQNGVNGYKVTSKKNGNSIFLPAAGLRDDDYLNNVGSSGYYLSSSLRSVCSNADFVKFSSSSVDWGATSRYYGRSVRAVCE